MKGKPTKKKKDAGETIVLKFEDLFKAVEDLNLSKKEFKDVHGGIRLHDRDFVVYDARPAKYGLRFYPGRDGLTHPIRLENKDDLERAAKIMRALMYGRIYKDKKLVSYKNQDFETASKKEFVEHLLKVN